MVNDIKITIVGDILGTTGYSSHTRQLANALMNEGIDVRIETNLPQGWEMYVNDNELAAVKKLADKERIVIMIAPPPFWRYATCNNPRKFVGFLVWEGDRLPKYWMEYLLDERVNQIWVPSAHVVSAILFSCLLYNVDAEKLQSKIKVISHGVDASIFKQLNNKEQNRPYTFFCNKGWRGTPQDRGGMQFLLKAFNDEFEKNENVRLIVKLNPAYLPQNIGIEQLLLPLKLEKDKSPILINKDPLSFETLNKMYNEADCYIGCQMADAFDLPSAEAMACGLPVITTNYGGQVEHVPKDCGLLIEGDMVDVVEDPQYEGVKWMQPRLDNIRKKMRYAFEHQNEMKKKGIKAKEFILNNFTWKHTAQKAINSLKEIDI